MRLFRNTLLEARNLLLAGEASAETADRQVGYVSAAPFSREYARQVGARPRRDVDRLRTPLRATAAVPARPLNFPRSGNGTLPELPR